MKKLTILLIFLTLNSCVSQNKIDTVAIKKYYFYFDSAHPKMTVYERNNYYKFYIQMDNDYPVIFIPKDSVMKEIRIESLNNYDYKDINWLNKLSNIERSRFFSRTATTSEYYLIEKRKSDKFLYLRKVYFIEEID